MERVQTKVDDDKRNAVYSAMLKELADVQYFNKVAVDIYGKVYYLDEAQVRALQVVAAKLSNTDKIAFEDFKRNVVVYSGKSIDQSKHEMGWENKGFFIRSFQKGFYNADNELCDRFYDARDKKLTLY